jgi:hypothetical protein
LPIKTQGFDHQELGFGHQNIGIWFTIKHDDLTEQRWGYMGRGRSPWFSDMKWMDIHLWAILGVCQGTFWSIAIYHHLSIFFHGCSLKFLPRGKSHVRNMANSERVSFYTVLWEIWGTSEPKASQGFQGNCVEIHPYRTKLQVAALRTEYDPVWPSHRQPCYLVSLGILPSQILGLNTVVAIAAPEVQPGETLKRWAVRNTLWRSGAQKLLHRIQDIQGIQGIQGASFIFHNLLQSISVHGSWSTTRTAIGTGKSMKSGLIMSGHEFGPGSPELRTLVCRGGSGDQHAMWIDQNRDSTI